MNVIERLSAAAIRARTLGHGTYNRHIARELLEISDDIKAAINSLKRTEEGEKSRAPERGKAA